VRLRKMGKLKSVNSIIGTSGRRFKQGGPLKTLMKMHSIKLLYILGVPTEKLYKIYQGVK